MTTSESTRVNDPEEILKELMELKKRNKRLADKLSMLRVFIDGNRYKSPVTYLNEVIEELRKP